MNKYCIIDTSDQLIINKLEEYGYKCIQTYKSSDVSQPISLHADVLYLKTDDKTIYVSECQKNNIEFLKSNGYNVKTVMLSTGYKTECKLNIVITDDLILCNPKTSIGISDISADKKVIYTNQGYTKCSTALIGNNSFITEDYSIYTALKSADINCLLIEKGGVSLAGYDYGFIGGASLYLKDKNTVLFTGDITKHSNYYDIKNFCEQNGTKIDYIKSNDLYDIGGFVSL